VTSQYLATTRKVEGGFIYVIHDGEREVIRSGPFLLERDALRTGQHFAADPDLEQYHLKR
jgi:hypothetical protein